MSDSLSKFYSIAIKDIRHLFSTPVKASIFFIYLFVCQFTWRDLVFRNYLPVKSSLLIGEKLAGKVSAIVDPSIPLLSPYGYDSQFSWILSLNPLPIDSLVAHGVDNYAYRSQRILLPFLTWLSVRDTTNILYGLWFWCFVGVIIGMIAVYKLSKWYRVSPLIPLLAYVFNPGLFITTVFPMSDGLACGLALLAFYLWLKNRTILSSLIFSLACLTKEYYAFFVFYMLVYEVWKSKSWKIVIKNLTILAISVVPMLIWQIIIHSKTGAWSFQASHGNFDWPFAGIYHCWMNCCEGYYFLREYTAGTLFYLLCGIALFKMTKWKHDPLAFVIICLCIHVMVYGKAILESDWSFLRVSIIFITLLPIQLLRMDLKVKQYTQ